MTSKPATQKRTEKPRTTGVAANRPVTAIHAPTGAIASESPRTRCESALRRFVKEYPRTTASASGDSARHREFRNPAARTNTAADSAQKAEAAATETAPAGISRRAVRGP